MSKWRHEDVILSSHLAQNYNSIVAAITDLLRYLIYNQRGARHIVYALLLSNHKWATTWNSHKVKVWFPQTFNSFSNNFIVCLSVMWCDHVCNIAVTVCYVMAAHLHKTANIHECKNRWVYSRISVQPWLIVLDILFLMQSYYYCGCCRSISLCNQN